MRSAVVLGSGRSGTSLLAGLFHSNGYFSGNNLWAPTQSNPLGYFEDEEINKINEDLLQQVVPWRPRGLIGAAWPVHRDRTRYTQRWLATLLPEVSVPAGPAISARIAAQTAHRPYLFKDPRFCYTLAAWAPHLLDDPIYLCIFREPQRTVNSIMQIAKKERYLRDLRLSTADAYAYWNAAYSSALQRREEIGGEWLFLHYDEVLGGQATELLERQLDALADRQMLRPELNRSSNVGEAPAQVEDLYKKLIQLSAAKYQPRIAPHRRSGDS